MLRVAGTWWCCGGEEAGHHSCQCLVLRGHVHGEGERAVGLSCTGTLAVPDGK